MPQNNRRILRFVSLDEAVLDSQELLAQGYIAVGNWDLSQCCRHLSLWLTYPVEGFPPMPFPMNITAWIMKNTFAPRWLKKTLRSGVWPAGVPTDKRTVIAPGGDDSAAVMEFRVAVEKFQAYSGPIQPSPLFGDLDRETWKQVHLLHVAHHLSFLIPQEKSE
ncbi:hypothetical protein Pla110_11050 [Polystyrenella longa]|uniref:DinB superfamily protein n=1 Tax=Polystyrenella longa TaxID=2528007 RepID=A0A518CJM0_9PLAN|nr:DUF1569 domain-containing protein [Polystyrenella longa]QDU79397.1 hypothetical protein Pla110_11050 [Polystyrenella longa]